MTARLAGRLEGQLGRAQAELGGSGQADGLGGEQPLFPEQDCGHPRSTPELQDRQKQAEFRLLLSSQPEYWAQSRL